MEAGAQTEAVNIVASACDKHEQNHELAAKAIKEALDQKFGKLWHVVVGEGFGFEVTHEMENVLYLLFGGNRGIILWKCS